MPVAAAPIPLDLAACLKSDGFAIVEGVVPAPAVKSLTDAIAAITSMGGDSHARGTRVYAVRNLIALVPAVRVLAASDAICALVTPILGAAARAVRGLLFDKTPGANWKVAWHQDLSIAVRQRSEVPGYGPWSVKDGVQHVQPPAAVLENMLTIRLSLDDCHADNGPLQVLPGSHAAGVLSPDGVADWRRRVAPFACEVPAGGAVLMRPLLLHASSSATSPAHRRVIHLEYAGVDLPGGLEWERDGAPA